MFKVNDNVYIWWCGSYERGKIAEIISDTYYKVTLSDGNIVCRLEDDIGKFKIVAIRKYGSTDEFDLDIASDTNKAIQIAKDEWNYISPYDRKYQTIEIRFNEDENGYDTLEWHRF